MKKMIIDSIKELKRSASAQNIKQKISPIALIQKQQKMEILIDQGSRQFFKGLVFCFPVVDLQLTPKQIQLIGENITASGGTIIPFSDKIIKEVVDYVCINPKLQIENVLKKIEHKLPFKQIIDYRFVTNTLKEKRLQNVEKYSLYINVEQLQSLAVRHQTKPIPKQTPSKKRKLDQNQENSQNTIKLSDSEQREKQYKIQANGKMEEEYGEKRDIEQIVLYEKMKENNFSMNKYIADELTKLMKIYATERDLGRKMAYMKAAAVIRGLDKEIQTEKDVENLRGIGDKISKKIKQFLETGKINKLQTLQNSEKNLARGELSQVWGIGPSKANELYNMGIKSLQELRKRTDLLNKNQKIGLKYYQDFQKKIPREKVGKMFDLVRNVVQTMVTSIDMYCIQICGSYRRGKADCGDMDIIISRKDGIFQKNFVADLVKELENIGFLTDHLTHSKAGEGRSSMTYMGVCQFQDTQHHRIDIKYYPIQEYAFAILHFTGNSTFNRMLRLHTMKLGLQLSDKGAVPKMEKGVIWVKPIPICHTEQDIFKFLGLDYKAPSQRDM